MTRIKTDLEIKSMREGGRMLATVLDILKKKTAIGATPQDMAAIASRELKSLGGKPAFLGYKGFPDVICISVNDQVQHSIPDNRPFKRGDVVNFDFGVKYQGLITDAGITIGVDKISSDDQRLIKGVEKALQKAIALVRNGRRVGDVSACIEGVLKEYKLGIVRELVGHGVGDQLHEEPEIPNWGRPGLGPLLRTGMTIAIEPIANLGDDPIKLESDGWTLRTVDGSKSAQCEHTILVTDNGAEILTDL